MYLTPSPQNNATCGKERKGKGEGKNHVECFQFKKKKISIIEYTHTHIFFISTFINPLGKFIRSVDPKKKIIFLIEFKN